MGVLDRPCDACGASGTLKVKEVQDQRRWGPFRLADREPYWMARCTRCQAVFAIRRGEPLA